MQPHLPSRPWLFAIIAAAGLAACGGGDDAPTPVDPPVTASNLADCHNPSMYVLGSSWSVTKEFSGDPSVSFYNTLPNEFRSTPADVFTTYVVAPPPAWGLPEGTVRLSGFPDGAIIDPRTWQLPQLDGINVRVHDGVVDTLLTARWYQFSLGFPALAYLRYQPGLSTPIALASGETYQGTPVARYSNSAGVYIAPDGARQVVPPPTDQDQYLLPDKVTIELMYVGRETISVPAGTFATCHTRTTSAGQVTEEWQVAEGPYRGIAIKGAKTQDGKSGFWVAKAVSADWK